MLHLDVLILIYHFAKLCSGAILEIGAFVGGATIAAAFGVRDSGQEKKLISIEPGGAVKHKRLGTRDILRDLERNLTRERVASMITAKAITVSSVFSIKAVQLSTGRKSGHLERVYSREPCCRYLYWFAKCEAR